MKKIYTVLKLKDEFTPGIKKAASSTEALAVKAKKSDWYAKQLGKTLKTNLAKGAKVAAGAMVSLGAAAVASASKLVNETIAATDTVDKMSQKIGISAQAYQEWDYAMGQSGVNISVMKNGMKTMTNLMKSADEGTESAQNAFKQLGISIYDTSGKLKNQETIMSEAIKRLAGMEDGSERAALASTLFGRAGAELAPLLNSGTEGIQELIDRAHQLGLVMDDETIKSGVKLGDTFDDVKQSLSKAALTVGAELMPYFQKGADLILTKLPQIKSAAGMVATGIGKLADAAGWLYDKSNILIPVLSGVVAGITAFKVISTVTTLIGAWKAVTAAYAATQGLANIAMLACPLTWIVIGITAAVAAGVALYKNWGKVCEWAGKMKEKMSSLLAPLKKVTNFLGKIFNTGNTNISISAKAQDDIRTSRGRKQSPRHALGTTYFAGGRTRFSEGGRSEEAVFPSGTRIIPADKAGKSQENRIVNVYVTVQGNVIGNEEYMEETGNYIAGKILPALDNI